MSNERERLAAALAGRYAIQRELGRGGMATVYLARDLKHDRDVAIKVLAPDVGAALGAERFLAEIKTTAKLQHPNILPLLDSGEAAGQLYYVMPFVRGESLRARLARAGAVPVAEAVPLLRNVLQALAAAHAQGVVHRDIKPENVLLSGDSAIVADFGIAKALGTVTRTGAGVTLTQAGTSVGTPAYMAPEQAAGDPAMDHRADLYAWGVLAHEMIAGTHPFARHVTPQAMFAAHLTEAPPVLASPTGPVPDGLRALVARCLAKAPEARPATADEALGALAAMQTPVASEAPTAPRSRSRVLTVAAALLVVIAVGGGLLARRLQGATPRSIAVLPFDIGADTANAYVADGLSAELTTKLAKVPGLAVRAYSSSKMLRGVAPTEAAKQLGVASVVTAQVRRADRRLHVNASLVNAADERVLWSESFDGADDDQFALQDRIATAIAGALRVTLSASALTPAARPMDPIVHDLVQRSRFLADQVTPAALAQAVRLAREAIARDSMSAPAWSALANALLLQADDAEPGVTVVADVTRATSRATAIDPSDPDALATDGFVKVAYERDTTRGERLLQEALRRDSTNATALAALAVTLMHRAPDSTATLLLRGIRYNPTATMALYFTQFLPGMFSRIPPDSGRAVCQRLRATVPPFGDNCDAQRLAQVGRAAEARAMYRAVDTTGFAGGLWAWRAMIAAAIGDTALARATLVRATAESRRTYVREDWMTMTYAALGDSTQALAWYRRACDAVSSGCFIARAELHRRFPGSARIGALADSIYALPVRR